MLAPLRCAAAKDAQVLTVDRLLRSKASKVQRLPHGFAEATKSPPKTLLNPPPPRQRSHPADCTEAPLALHSGVCSSTEREAGGEGVEFSLLTASPSLVELSSAHYSSTAQAALPVSVNRRSCTNDTSGGSSCHSSTGCTDSFSGGKACGSVEWAVAEGVGTETDELESLATKELHMRLRSVKRTLPLTALWLVAQVSFDASLTLLSITSNSVIQSTSVFLSYFLAVVFLKQQTRRSVLTWLVILAAGVGLISSHVPTTQHVPAGDVGVTGAGVAAAGMQAMVSALPKQPDALVPPPILSSAVHAVQVLNSSQVAALSSPQEVEEPLWEGLSDLAAEFNAAPADHSPQETSADREAFQTNLGVNADTVEPSVALVGDPPGAFHAVLEAAALGPTAVAGPPAAALDDPDQAAAAEDTPEAAASDSALGYMLSFMAAAAYALHTTALKAQEISDPDFDVELIYGMMGLWVLVALPALTLLIHVFRVEPFMWPNLLSWVVLLLCGLVGTALADICWGRAVFLLNPVVATAASNVQIPISLLLDALVVGRSFDSWYFIGMTAVLTAVVAVTLITADKHHHKRRVHAPVMETCNSAVVEV
ncbi:hypothetical protein cyc_03177 [Cyclospora cayetanensis]|uniref:EamA domain-containing protein n=1 Tax=Cyclospora cayetanensis TaxID=88456 RepID=A0A1D3D9H7_9EIME|nr:hypothetical protein cyc_03177 [Cyclospora cayetanensis]